MIVFMYFASVIHFPTSSVSLSPWRCGMIQDCRFYTSVGFIHKLPPGPRDKKAEPQITEATRFCCIDDS